MTAKIERVVTSGIFSLDGGDFAVENNVWIIGDDSEAVIIDAAHDSDAILEALNGRRLIAVVCTHAHNDHINAARELVARADSEVRLHPDDQMLWEAVYPDLAFVPLRDGEVFDVAGVTLHVIHTPGHSPGGVCLLVPEMNVLFSGDTLFHGGPGATGRSFSDFPTILVSIRERLLSLPPETQVLTGHGQGTSIGEEARGFDEWVTRGH